MSGGHLSTSLYDQKGGSLVKGKNVDFSRGLIFVGRSKKHQRPTNLVLILQSQKKTTDGGKRG